MKKSLIISISFLLIGIGIGISIVTWTNDEDDIDSTLESVEVIEDLPEYSGIFDDTATGLNYLKNGNFYSGDKSYKLVIDTSYMDLVGNAIYWYDKAISEFPKTPVANRALKDKIKTLIGWTDGHGDDRRDYGLADRTKASFYFPLIETTYALLEKDFPEDSELSAFAFQIAQRYSFYMIAEQMVVVEARQQLTDVITQSHLTVSDWRAIISRVPQFLEASSIALDANVRSLTDFRDAAEALNISISEAMLQSLEQLKTTVQKNNKYIAPIRKWMNKTIELAKGKDTFYSHLARVAKYE